MIAYTTVGTNDYPKATEFYDALLGEMGAKRLWQDERFASYGVAMDQPMFAVCTPDNGGTATSGNGAMVTLACSDTEMVDTLPHGTHDFRVLYMTGFSEDKISAHGIKSQHAALLQKPFSREDLARKVREILDTDQAHQKSPSK